MKILFSNLLLLLFLLTVNYCCAQKMVQTVADLKKLKSNEHQFIGKPLRVLLKQIEPKIIMFDGNLPNPSNEVNTYMRFRFVDKKGYDSITSLGKYPPSFRIIFSPNDKKQLLKKHLTKERVWTRRDAKEYGDLIIGLILIREN